MLGRYIGSIWKGNFPMGTFIINVAGSFLLGLLVFHPAFAGALNKDVSIGIGVGFLGSFTTFSTFEYETLQLLEERKVALAAAYVLSSFVLGFAAAWVVKFF